MLYEVITQCNATDGHHANAQRRASPGEQADVGRYRLGFGRGREHGPEGHMVRSGRHSGFGAPPGVVTGDPEPPVGTKQRACRGDIAIVLAQMDAIGIHRQRQVEIVVDQEFDPRRAAQGAHARRLGESYNFV